MIPGLEQKSALLRHSCMQSWPIENVLGMFARVSNVKNQPPSFGKLTFIPCRTHWYLYKCTLKVQILQLEMQSRSKVKLNFDHGLSSVLPIW